MRRLFTFATVLLLAAPAWADFADGQAAYERGDYETAFEEWLPLAEQGNSEAQLALEVLEATVAEVDAAEQGNVCAQVALEARRHLALAEAQLGLAAIVAENLAQLIRTGHCHQCDLSGADLSGADLSSANLGGAGLSGANLSGANLSNAKLSGANLSGANLSGANLSWANLSYTNLRAANLDEASVEDAYLNGADLSRANLSGANLSWANLSCANLGGANLSGADLTGAVLQPANLTGANFSGANLSGAGEAKCPHDEYFFPLGRWQGSNPEKAYYFGIQIQNLVRERDLRGLFLLVNGELYSGPRKSFVENRSFGEIFDENWRSSILGSDPPCGPSGSYVDTFMLASGLIWFSPHDGTITTLNGAIQVNDNGEEPGLVKSGCHFNNEGIYVCDGFTACMFYDSILQVQKVDDDERYRLNHWLDTYKHRDEKTWIDSLEGLVQTEGRRGSWGTGHCLTEYLDFGYLTLYHGDVGCSEVKRVAPNGYMFSVISDDSNFEGLCWPVALKSDYP